MTAILATILCTRIQPPLTNPVMNFTKDVKQDVWKLSFENPVNQKILCKKLAFSRSNLRPDKILRIIEIALIIVSLFIGLVFFQGIIVNLISIGIITFLAIDVATSIIVGSMRNEDDRLFSKLCSQIQVIFNKNIPHPDGAATTKKIDFSYKTHLFKTDKIFRLDAEPKIESYMQTFYEIKPCFLESRIVKG